MVGNKEARRIENRTLADWGTSGVERFALRMNLDSYTVPLTLFNVTKVTMHKGFTFYGDYGN